MHYTSLILSIAVLLPNLFLFGSPPRNQPLQIQNKSHPIYPIAEGIGRLGVLTLPVFSTMHVDRPYEWVSLTGMLIFLLFYYYGWIRYFTGNREYGLLFSPLFGVPVPLAISPVLYFLCASVILHSPFMLISSLILAAGHIPASLNICRQL